MVFLLFFIWDLEGIRLRFQFFRIHRHHPSFLNKMKISIGKEVVVGGSGSTTLNESGMVGEAWRDCI